MTVDTKGQWWTGSTPDDIRAFLEAYSSDTYPIDDFRLARCKCGSVVFKLWADDDEGVARRQCSGCAAEHYICDSADYWSDAEPEEWRCVECGTDQTNVGVGFSFYERSKDIRWLFVGIRCTACRILGCFAGRKIGYSDDTLIDRA